jgi:hypothetical protein
VATAIFSYGTYQGTLLNRSSKAYFNENIAAIISTWSSDELLKRSSPDLLKINPEQIDKMFAKLSAIGPAQSIGEPKGNAWVVHSTKNGKVTTATYVATAQFKNGEGHITVRLILSPAGQWQFSSFAVDSPLFVQ